MTWSGVRRVPYRLVKRRSEAGWRPGVEIPDSVSTKSQYRRFELCEAGRYQRRLLDQVVDSHDHPVELHADMAGILGGFRDVVELMQTNGKLQQRNRQHGNPRRTSLQV